MHRILALFVLFASAGAPIAGGDCAFAHTTRGIVRALPGHDVAHGHGSSGAPAERRPRDAGHRCELDRTCGAVVALPATSSAIGVAGVEMRDDDRAGRRLSAVHLDADPPPPRLT